MTPKRIARSALLVTPALVFMTLAVMTPLTAAADEVVCKPNYDFCIEVDGSFPPDARFFVGDARGKFLVDIPSQSKSLLIDLPSKKAVTVPRNNVKPDGAAGAVRVVDPGVSGAPAYALSIEGPVLRFNTDTSKVRVLKVTERPPIIGPVTFDTLVADRIEYREGMKAYEPNKTAIDAIKASKKPVEIEAYFGTWCPHCKMYMPKFLRVIQDAGNPNIKLTLVGVPKDFGNKEGPWAGKNIQAIPAVMVKYQGNELTRLSAAEGVLPEEELAALLKTLP
ncbi:MAG TPA: thioredoxin family protein [Candidatus Polarisedimenticolia bacterium]|nr:thioredoxin family protein [Candidatus Polarisedimenticolia bacterium]